MQHAKAPGVPGRHRPVGAVLALGVLINHFDRVALPVAVEQAAEHPFEQESIAAHDAIRAGDRTVAHW